MKKTTGWKKYEPFAGQTNHSHNSGLVLWDRGNSMWEARWRGLASWDVITHDLEDAKRIALEDLLKIVDVEVVKMTHVRENLLKSLGRPS